ncbi:DUF202 domain-containing protein [Kitasatospora camelliae]|uniref:DUF202 domain-containing protein n=1 Tax=Kitasatospora camelliae TaxID=3156397 RepID=A0AAU8JZ39_9ACTN
MTAPGGGRGGPVRDPGLQPERTLLAWSRTALLLVVDAVLLLRTGLVRRQAGLTVLGGLLAAAAAGFYGYGLRRRRRAGRSPGGAPEAVRALPVRVLAVVVAVVAAGCAWGVLAGPAPR